jgi:hypothetical protein
VERINNINANLASMHLVYQPDVVLAVASVPAEPMVDAHVVQALEEASALCEGLGDVMQLEFGGKLPAGNDMPSALRH